MLAETTFTNFFGVASDIFDIVVTKQNLNYEIDM
jgi:hypothetical protein